MTFVSPGWLLGLLLLPVVVVAYVLARRKRRQRTAALAAQGLFTTGLARGRSWRLHVPFALFLVALALLVVATARPMATIKTPRREATIVLAIDVSNSMAAADIKPSRIGAAKITAEDFVREQPSGVRIGVVAFAENAEKTTVFAFKDAFDAGVAVRGEPRCVEAVARGQAVVHALAHRFELGGHQPGRLGAGQP